MNKKFTSDELPLAQLLDQAASGELQLPDFQRGWVWDDNHIRSLLASISLSYPIGTVMTLVAGNPDVNFKARLLEGVKLSPRPEPETLLLDGQQRLTSLFQALNSRDPVRTRSRRGKKPLRLHYYANIEACIDPHVDREEDGIVGIPEDRIVRSDFGRVIDLDIRTRDQEIATQMFPLDIILDGAVTTDWQLQYVTSGPGDMAERLDKWKQFQAAVVNPFLHYHVPTIELAKSTPKEAVCQVFEKVNTGGVTLTVFELLTATYAADNFELRKDWETRQQRFSKIALLKKVDATAFLQIVTLLATYHRRRLHLAAHPDDDKAPAVSCKRREVLRLLFDDYKQWADRAEEGLRKTVPFLHKQCIFRYRDLPYRTQLVPLAAIFGWLGGRAESYKSNKRLGRWFWCGVLGKMYGGATETRFALDLEDCVAWIEGPPSPARCKPRSSKRSGYSRYARVTVPLIRACTRSRLNRVLAISRPASRSMSTPNMEQAIDIHHVFPRNWCRKHDFSMNVANCIVNKTALDARTNRQIGGSAPSVYLSRIESVDGIQRHVLDGFLRSHDIDPVALRHNDFPHYFNQRFESLLKHVEQAMSKPVNRRPDRDESPFFQREINIESGVQSLIESGESATVEFKSTARLNLHSNRRDEAITWAVIKTIAAFMNTDGGTLLIGVNDRGNPVGIEPDYLYVRGANRDGWELWITTAIKNALGSVVATDLHVHYCTIEDRTIARIDVRRGTQPTFASRKGKAREVFFARLNNATEELSGSALLEYRQKHWPQ